MKQLNAPTIRPLNHESIHTMGRVVWRNNEALFSYPGVTFEFTIQADSFAIDVQPYKGKGRLDVYFDGTLRKQLIIKSAQQHSFKLNSANKPIQVQLVNRGETWHGIMQIKGLIIDNGALLNPPNVRLHKLLFIGDSVTCGALLNRNPKGNKGPHLSDSYHSFGMQIGRKLNAQVHLIGYGGRGILRSWDGNPNDLQGADFFELAIPSSDAMIHWDHHSYLPDLVVISLATNDFNLGVPPQTQFETAYRSLIQRVLMVHPQAHVAITEGSMLNNNAIGEGHKSIAKNYLNNVIMAINNKRVCYMPSNYYPGDDSDPHPTREQHSKIADDFVMHIRRIMSWS